jgi:hypothetical protein
MNQLVQTTQYSTAAYNTFKIENAWVQVVIYILLAISIVGSLAAALFCIARGGSLEWIWYFGVFVKVACRFNR